MVAKIPQVTNWSVAPQNGQVNYFTLMNTWLLESTSVIASLNTAITKINEAGQDINNIGQNAINAITLDTIDDLLSYKGSGYVVVKDILRGGNFVSKTATEINPYTGLVYTTDGGTVFAKLGGGFWVRQYSGAVNVEWFGAVNNIEQDQTAVLNRALHHCYNTSNSTLIIDVKIGAYGVIDYNSDVFLIGSGEIVSEYYLNNFAVCGKDYNSTGKINLINNLTLPKRKDLTVVIVGDSIATYYADSVDTNFSVARYYEQELIKIPEISTVHNRAIGGAVIESLDAAVLPQSLINIATNQNKWYTDFSLPWLDYVTSLNPDIVIIAFGMNQGSGNASSYDSLESVREKLKLHSPKVEIVYATTPTPVTRFDSSIFGSSAEQNSRLNVANMTRAYARKNNEYCIDVGRNVRRIVNGIDEAFSRPMLRDTYVPTSLRTKTTFFSASASFNFVDNSSTWQIRFNITAPGVENAIIVYNNRVIIYSGTTILTTVSFPYTLSGTPNMTVTHSPNGYVSIYHERNLLAKTLVAFHYYTPSTIRLDGTDIKYFPFINISGGKLITGTEMFGDFIEGSYGLKSLENGGGNGVNHPTSTGITMGYAPAIDEFIQDLKENLSVPTYNRIGQQTIYNIINNPSTAGEVSLIPGHKFSNFSYILFTTINSGAAHNTVIGGETYAIGFRTAIDARSSATTTLTEKSLFEMLSDTTFKLTVPSGCTDGLWLITGFYVPKD